MPTTCSAVSGRVNMDHCFSTLSADAQEEYFLLSFDQAVAEPDPSNFNLFRVLIQLHWMHDLIVWVLLHSSDKLLDCPTLIMRQAKHRCVEIGSNKLFPHQAASLLKSSFSIISQSIHCEAST